MATTVAFVMSAAVWEDTRHPALELDATIRPFRYSIDTDTTLAQLQTKKGVHSSASPGITLGAVLTNMQYRVQVGTTLTGRHTLAITVGYRPATLFVASEMTKDRCVYRHVLDHESKHIAIFEEETSRWNQELAQFVASPAAQQFSASQLQASAERLVINMDRRVYLRHAQLDSPAEYAENLTACGGNVKRLAYGKPVVAQPRVVQLARVTVTAKSPAHARSSHTLNFDSTE